METLLKLIVGDIFAFTYGGDDDIDKDFAAMQLQRNAATLKTLDSETFRAFVAYVEEQAKRETMAGDQNRAEQLIRMIDNLGLREE